MLSIPPDSVCFLILNNLIPQTHQLNLARQQTLFSLSVPQLLFAVCVVNVKLVIKCVLEDQY